MNRSQVKSQLGAGLNTGKIKAVLFDFGGTIDADGIAWKERFYPIYRAAGLGWPFEEFTKYFYFADDTITEKTLTRTSYFQTLEKQSALLLKKAKAYQKPLAQKIARAFLNDSLKNIRRNLPLIRALSKRYRLGVVANFYGNLKTIARESGLAPCLDAAIDSAEVGCIKPDRRIFFEALNRIGVRPQEAVFVGDSLPRDMAGAKAIGMPHIWLKGKLAKEKQACCRKDPVIRSFLDLEKILLSN